MEETGSIFKHKKYNLIDKWSSDVLKLLLKKFSSAKKSVAFACFCKEAFKDPSLPSLL